MSGRCFSLTIWSFLPLRNERVDLKFRPGAEFFCTAVTARNLTSVSRQQPLLNCCSEKRKNKPYLLRSKLLAMGFWLNHVTLVSNLKICNFHLSHDISTVHFKNHQQKTSKDVENTLSVVIGLKNSANYDMV